MDKKLKNQLFFLAFIEGGAVMCIELCSAKILSPFFGTSVYVWAAVLGITLTALMVGYYLGGYLSAKNKNINLIFWMMTIGGCLLTLTPFISNKILPITINLNLLLGTVVSLISFLFFPLVMFGATSPLLINFLTKQADESGKSSGTVYSVSTFGGIITTFLVGFYTLPTFGIQKTLYFYGVLVVVTSIVIAGLTRNLNKQMAGQARHDVPLGNNKMMFLLLAIALLSYNFTSKKNTEIIYQSDGIMGELKVVDRMYGGGKEYREMMVNNISQTIMDKQNPSVSFWNYVGVLTYNLESYSKGKKVLLLGLGGGTLYKQLQQKGFDVDVVEIDARIEQVAKKYFYIENELNVVVDDARHFIKTTDKKYDVVIYDLYHSETPPVHLMTKEAFSEIKHMLNPEGVFVVNFYGFLESKRGRAARSIYKTLLSQKFDVRLFATEGEEKHRNFLFICGKSELKATQPIVHKLIYELDINFDDALVLTDDKPILEHIYLDAALQWRKDYNEQNAKYFLRN
ncbi:MAG: Polyamine aminopropyltransferase [Flavobacteriales bacterium]|nr:Polyamine aminopropyltransferase [Flavobacteriales bacterium]